MQQDAMALFRSAPWGDIYPRLALHAAGEVRRKIWRGQRNGHVPGGHEAADFVQRAVLATLAGLHTWDPKNKTLLAHLEDSITRDVSNISKGEGNKISCSYALDDEYLTNNPYYRIVEYLSIKSPSPEEKVSFSALMSYIKEYVIGDDQNLVLLIDAAAICGWKSNETLACFLGDSVESIRNKKRRLERRLQPLCFEFDLIQRGKK